LLTLLERCRDEGIHRITLSTHGLRLIHDQDLVRALKAIDARVILSFDSFQEDINEAMLGGRFLSPKLKVLETLAEANISTTLLPVLAQGYNDDELGAFIDLALQRPFIRSVEFHTMTFTGQGGRGFDSEARYGTYDVLCDIEAQTQGRLRVDDFIPSPSAHPLCYLVNYLLRLDDGRYLPFVRFMSPARLRRLLRGHLYLEPDAQMQDELKEVIDDLWSGVTACDEGELVLASLRGMIDRVFDPSLDEAGRLLRSESYAKTIYVHAHMDEDNFDTDRIQQCCVGIAEPDGTNIPSCAYNVLYRNRDARFNLVPQANLVTLGAGRTAPPTSVDVPAS